MNGFVVTVDFKPKPGAQSPQFVTFNKTSAELAMNKNVARFDLILSNNRH